MRVKEEDGMDECRWMNRDSETEEKEDLIQRQSEATYTHTYIN